jgi:hypothetical protein
MKILLVVLTLAASTPALASQQAQQAGFWKKKGTAIHNTNGGNVGIGTASPAAKLEVAGTVRVEGKLTLAPSGDQALDVSTGSIYKDGGLFMHTQGGVANTAVGLLALANVTSGYYSTANGNEALAFNTTGAANTACGARALFANTTNSINTAIGFQAMEYNSGNSNVAFGWRALRNNSGQYNTGVGVRVLDSPSGNFNTVIGSHSLYSNTTGYSNTASGFGVLTFNTTGSYNTAAGEGALGQNTTGQHHTATGWLALSNNTTGNRNNAVGSQALYFNSTGYSNTAIGHKALRSNSTGAYNIGVGYRAGYSLTTGNNNIAIGSGGVAGDSNTIRIGGGVHSRTFIYGIRGVTTGVADAIPVLIDSGGQLGTVSSSRRFKEDIRDMEDATERLMDLRPVLFRFKEREGPDEYGLIAEEVADVFPDLVVYDGEGKPETVKYHLLSTMLLNEVQRMQREMDEVLERLAALERTTPTKLEGAPASLR